VQSITIEDEDNVNSQLKIITKTVKPKRPKAPRKKPNAQSGDIYHKTTHSTQVNILDPIDINNFDPNSFFEQIKISANVKHSFDSTFPTSEAIIKKGGIDYNIKASSSWTTKNVDGVKVTNKDGKLHFKYSGEERCVPDLSLLSSGIVILNLVKD
jgi:hypothetical protein